MQCNKVVLFPKSYLKYFNIICNSASSVTIATYFTYMLLWFVMLVSTWNYREERSLA